MEPKQELLFWVKVDLGVMAMKEYSMFPTSVGLEPHHQIQFCVIPQTPLEGGEHFTLLQRMQLAYSKSRKKSKELIFIYCRLFSSSWKGFFLCVVSSFTEKKQQKKPTKMRKKVSNK